MVVQKCFVPCFGSLILWCCIMTRAFLEARKVVNPAPPTITFYWYAKHYGIKQAKSCKYPNFPFTFSEFPFSTFLLNKLFRANCHILGEGGGWVEVSLDKNIGKIYLLRGDSEIEREIEITIETCKIYQVLNFQLNLKIILVQKLHFLWGKSWYQNFILGDDNLFNADSQLLVLFF